MERGTRGREGVRGGWGRVWWKVGVAGESDIICGRRHMSQGCMAMGQLSVSKKAGSL